MDFGAALQTREGRVTQAAPSALFSAQPGRKILGGDVCSEAAQCQEQSKWILLCSVGLGVYA